MKFYTPEEIANELQVTPGTVRRWLSEGTLKGVKVERHWRIRQSDYEAFTQPADPSDFAAEELQQSLGEFNIPTPGPDYENWDDCCKIAHEMGYIEGYTDVCTALGHRAEAILDNYSYCLNKSPREVIEDFYERNPEAAARARARETARVMESLLLNTGDMALRDTLARQFKSLAESYTRRNPSPEPPQSDPDDSTPEPADPAELTEHPNPSPS